MLCPVCLVFKGDASPLADHFIKMAGKSDADHVMFLNRYLTRYSMNSDDLATLLEKFFRIDSSFTAWVIRVFIGRFYGESPHPFIIENQHPKPYLIKGYAMEHHHFLRQWVKSCSLIMGNTDNDEVVRYEYENITSEWFGTDKFPSHHELLLRMGESYGVSRDSIMRSSPLPATVSAMKFWDETCRKRSWQEGMAAMHSLELIANRKIVDYGGRYGYFDPSLMNSNEIMEEAKDFLKEGYLADESHSEVALKIIERNSDNEKIGECQSVFIRSAEYFYDYLLARMERGMMIENKQ